MHRNPIRVGDDLSISFATGAVKITPSQGLRVAEALIRASAHQMIVEEAERAGRAPAPARAARRGRCGR
jgi:hypothetical protein